MRMVIVVIVLLSAMFVPASEVVKGRVRMATEPSLIE